MSVIISSVRKRDLFLVKSSESRSFVLDDFGNIVANFDIVITECSYDYHGDLWPLVLGNELSVAKTISAKVSGGSTQTQTDTKMITYKVERLENLETDIGELRCYKVNEINTQEDIECSWWYSTTSKNNVVLKYSDGSELVLKSYKLN
jgi:hypothetical protein